MQTLSIRLLTLLFFSFLLSACGEQAKQMSLEVNATMNGKPVSHAKVMLNGKLLGETGDNGQLLANSDQIPGKEVVIEVTAEVAGIDIQPWKKQFKVIPPNKGEVLKYAFNANLKSSTFVTFSVQQKGTPIADATIKAGNEVIGNTNEKGEFLYKYTSISKKPVSFEVSKAGYSVWRQSAALKSGARFNVALSKHIALTIEAMEDQYGRSAGVPGVTISVDGQSLGQTSASGSLTYHYEGDPGKKVSIVYSAPGYWPSEWSTSVTLNGDAPVSHYFYPLTPKPIRVGLLHFSGNTPGVDMKDVLAQTQTAILSRLFKYSVFRSVPTDALEEEIKRQKLNVAKITSQGWLGTKLQQTVDMIVVGSVAKDEKGYFIEANFHSAGGKLIFSQLIRASSSSDINSAAKGIAENVIERFPFEGLVIAQKDDRFEINLGEPYSISRGSEFAVIVPAAGKEAAHTGARLLVKKVSDKSSMAELGDSKTGEKVAVGDRVVRRVQHEGESDSGREYVNLLVKGGAGKEASPVAGASIYLNKDWVGVTGSNGRAEVAMRTGKDYSLMLYRHGYQQVAEKIRIEKNADTKEYVMASNTATFKVESTPSNATIFVDGEEFGRTPLAGKSIDLGFHTVRITAGENFRDWEEVVEFNQKIEDRTGSRKIVLHKDYMTLGEKAEARGDIDAAMAAYAATEKGNPDYSSAHHRLAQLYLDEKDDHDSAIREFENVLSLPENEQLLFKQFSVAYTNLGHAYHDKGNALMNSDNNAAVPYFVKAIQNLKTAKQNTRFFPKDGYDEAVHDTYFYMALSNQKLYLITKRSSFLNEANLAWRDYFDFFPSRLEGNPAFEKNREAAKKFWGQIKNK